MGALWYLYRTTIKNKILSALRKPITYFGILFFGGYAVMMCWGLIMMATDFKVADPKGLVILLTASVLFSFPMNFFTYSRKKGLLFRTGDVHLVFSSPIRPKTILIYTYLKMIPFSILTSLFLAAGGIFLFKVNIGRIILYLIASYLICKVFEASLVVILFGNETISEGKMKLLKISIQMIAALPVVLLLYLLFTNPVDIKFAGLYFNHPLLQMIPVIGWNIALIRLLLLDATGLTVICSILYFATTFLVFLYARKMRCTGEYYEEAMTFAEDYAEAMKRSKKGEIVVVGKKSKFKSAQIHYKGTGAKAIFYRQLLEYKKRRFFLFGFTSLVNLAIGILIGVVYLKNKAEFDIASAYIVPGVCAYITFIFSGYATKWTKELEYAYTFLIPDTEFRKLWYATLVEHIRSIVDGFLIALPAGIALHLPVIQIILSALIYVCLQANKLYIEVLAHALIGDSLGRIGKQFFKMFVQGIVIGIAIASAAVGTVTIGTEVGYIMFLVFTVMATALIFLLAAKVYHKMEC